MFSLSLRDVELPLPIESQVAKLEVRKNEVPRFAVIRNLAIAFRAWCGTTMKRSAGARQRM